ncbi:MAG: hypothetical protein CMD35_00230 [Flavobacteriales bacterium]|nr:hypothetical protein [Flavobacteriales bacterium]
MTNRRLLVIIWSCLLFFVGFSYGQNDCPGLPSRASFDTLGYISANIPTNPDSAEGKLYLGQGWIKRPQDLNTIRPGFIPSNKPSWAIAIAVAWNLGRNTVQRVEYPNMNYWMATLIQETELRCATGLTWDDPSKVPDAYNPSTVYAAQINNGCLQIEGPGSAWSALQQAYPNGRIPINSNSGANADMYDLLIEGVDGFEASAIVKTYYDAYTSQIFNYNVGWDFYENVDCKQNNHDPYAYTKMSASAYNGGPNAFLNAEAAINDTGPGIWGGLPATTANYGNDIARWVSVLEDNTSYAEYPTGSSWGGWYDDPVPYSEVTKYLNIIQPMYSDVDFATEIIPFVEEAFIASAGSLSGTINFSDFGEVIDAIVLHLPADKPTPVDGSPIGVDLSCTGDFIPYGHVDILNGTTTMCLGQSVTLELMVDAGNDPDIQYKWFKGDAVSGTLIGTNKTITITPDQLGTQNYAGQICNSNGCYTVYSNTQNSCQDPRNINGWNVTANDCNLCPFVASGTSVNAVCKGTPDGSITLNLTNDPSDYRVTYIATTPVGNDTVVLETSGSTVQFDGVRDGAYNFTLEDLSDPSCKAYTTVIVGYDTEINEYIKADLLNIESCQADLEADILEQPTPCLWKVVAISKPTFQWEPAVNALVSTSTGKTLIQKHTADLPAPNEYDQWTSAQPSVFWLSLNTGDVISMGTALTTTPGATQWYDYDFFIYDEADNQVYSGTSPMGSSVFGYNHMIGDYTVTCPQNVPDYSIAWNPGINNENTTAIHTEGNVTVQGSDRIYIVTATNNTNPQCILKDSVIVPGDLNCGTVCANPGTVTLVDASDVKLTDSVFSCADSSIHTMLVGNDPRTFLFELYKDGTAQTPTNTTGDFTVTDDGEYWVLVKDESDPSNVDCHVYSDTIQFIKQSVPSAPAYKSGDTVFCDGTTENELAITSVESVTNYDWRYTGTGVSFTPQPTDTSAKFDVATGATNGDMIIVASNDCGADSVSISIEILTPPLVDLGNDTSVCAASGPLTLDAQNVGYTYEWQDASSDKTFDVIQDGDYWVVVSNVACSDTDSIFVEVLGSTVLDLGKDTVLCDNGITLDVGTGFTSVIWQDGSNSQEFQVTVSGTYYVDVEDANGCQGSDTIVVTINTTPAVNLGSDISICTTSPSVTFDAGNPGADYLWSTGDVTQTIQKGNGEAGEYWVIVTENGCSDTDSVILSVATELTVDLGEDFDICTGTTTELDAGYGTGYTFNWNEGGLQNDSTFTTSHGEVRLEVQDAGGCYGRDTVFVTEVNPLVIDLGDDQSICSGDAALTFSMESGRTDVSVVGWQDGSTDYTITSGDAGWYWLEVDSAGCVYRDSLELIVHQLPTVDLGSDTFICVGTTPTITLSGGTFITYQWADITNSVPTMLGDSETQDISSVGTYGLVVTDGNNCVNGDTIQVTEEQGTAVGFGLDTTICPSGTATISVPTGLQQLTGSSWTWINDGSSSASYTVSNESDGSVVHVILDFTNPSGCVTRDTATVRVDNNLPLSLSDTSICEGDDVVFSSGYPASGYTYTWQDNSTGNTFAITGAQSSDAGVVSLSMVSDEGCTGSASVQLTVNALPDPQLSASPICFGEDRILDHGLTGVQSVWDHGETSNPITVTTAGIYRVTVTDGNNCSDTASVSLIVNTPPSFTLPSDTTLCLGEEYALGTGMDEGTHTHQWSGGSNSTTADIVVTASGEYRVNVTELATTCMSSDTITFTFLDVPSVDLGPDTNLCIGETADLISLVTDASYVFTWSTGSSSSSIQVLNTGEYWLEAANGSCLDRDSITVVFYDNPVSELMNDTIVCFDDIENGLILDPGRNGEDYLWSSGETTQTISVDEKGTYLVGITNLAGCLTEDRVEIKEDCPAHVWLPNSFTADDNSLNDVWMIQGRSIESVEVFVYNRWGELVWEGNALGQFWDGTYMGKPAQEDVYVYSLSYTYYNVNNKLQRKKRQGWVTLLR